MIVVVERYLGDFKWSKAFDYELDETKITQVNNDGLNGYRVYKIRGRPLDIYFHYHKSDWINFTSKWKKGFLFFGEEENPIFPYAMRKGIFTLEQPHKRIKE